MAMLGAVAGLLGTAFSVIGSIRQGEAQEAQYKSQAQWDQAKAQEERAAGQAQAANKQREAKLVMSRDLAVAASSGGGAADPTALNVAAGVGAQGEYNAKSALYEGETAGRDYDYQAQVYRMQAKQAKLAGFINAGSSILSGISGFAQNYGMPTLGSSSNLYYA